VKVAVALACPLQSTHAPKVLAGGRGAVAEQILNIAFAQGVRVREDADLAQLLAAVDIDSEIPVQAFAAVAEILVYVWRANGAAAGANPLGPDAAPPNQPFMERAKGLAG
jgi:flagellar biosynthesis protein